MTIRRNICSVSLLLCALTLGCGTQLQRPSVDTALIEAERQRQIELAVTDRWGRERKLFHIANRISAAGAELCGEQIDYRAGFRFIDRNSLPEENRAIVTKVLNLISENTHIVDVVPALPADAAGLKIGDTILKVANHSVSEMTPKAKSKVEPIAKILQASSKAPFDIEIRRGEDVKRITINPVPMCKYPVNLAEDDKVNAFADGEKIGITTGMIRFAKDDDELAFIVSHEIAHNALGHVDRIRGNQLLGGGLGLLLDIGVAVLGVNTGGAFTRAGMDTAGLVFSQDFELEADYLGVYFAGRAGYDVTKAPDFFRRMSNEHPGAIKGNFLATHPSNPERTMAVESSIRELKQKVRAEVPLIPTLRSPSVTQASEPDKATREAE